jgi:hypothetical protein
MLDAGFKLPVCPPKTRLDSNLELDRTLSEPHDEENEGTKFLISAVTIAEQLGRISAAPLCAEDEMTQVEDLKSLIEIGRTDPYCIDSLIGWGLFESVQSILARGPSCLIAGAFKLLSTVIRGYRGSLLSILEGLEGHGLHILYLLRFMSFGEDGEKVTQAQVEVADEGLLFMSTILRRVTLRNSEVKGILGFCCNREHLESLTRRALDVILQVVSSRCYKSALLIPFELPEVVRGCLSRDTFYGTFLACAIVAQLFIRGRELVSLCRPPGSGSPEIPEIDPGLFMQIDLWDLLWSHRWSAFPAGQLVVFIETIETVFGVIVHLNHLLGTFEVSWIQDLVNLCSHMSLTVKTALFHLIWDLVVVLPIEPAEHVSCGCLLDLPSEAVSLVIEIWLGLGSEFVTSDFAFSAPTLDVINKLSIWWLRLSEYADGPGPGPEIMGGLKDWALAQGYEESMKEKFDAIYRLVFPSKKAEEGGE